MLQLSIPDRERSSSLEITRCSQALSLVVISLPIITPATQNSQNYDRTIIIVLKTLYCAFQSKQFFSQLPAPFSSLNNIFCLPQLNAFSLTSLICSFLSIFKWFWSSSFIEFHSLTSSGLQCFSASRRYLAAEQRRFTVFSSWCIISYDESLSRDLSLEFWDSEM